MLIVAICAVLAGCASTATDFRSSPPNLSVSSKKLAREVAVCISDGWGNELNGVNTRSIGGGVTVTFVANGLIYYMADVMESSDGSATKYWAGTFTLSHYVEKFGGIVKGCQL